mgnify:CR=1 FL=1
MRYLDLVEIEREARRRRSEELARLFASLARAIIRMISFKGAPAKQAPARPATCQ